MQLQSKYLRLPDLILYITHISTASPTEQEYGLPMQRV